MDEYLGATEVFNFGDGRIARKAADLTSAWATTREKVCALGTFVREWIRLEVRGTSRVARASEVLCFMAGSATEKAVLFTALCRASGLPCRIKLQKLSGAPDRWTALGAMAKAEWNDAHPVNEVLVDGGWITVDVSLDSEAASRLDLMMPALSGEGDATLAEAVSWVPDALFRLRAEPESDEQVPAEVVRLTLTAASSGD